MGLAASQVRFLGLTARKADCELQISINSMHKMALTREMTELTREYNSRLQAKQVSFYHKGQYNKINYQYLMGYGKTYTAILNSDKYALKSNNSMVLTDYKGQVVLNDSYAQAITKVLGNDCMNAQGQGKPFDKSNIPAILAELLPGNTYFNAETIDSVHNGGNIESQYAATIIKTLTGEVVKTDAVQDNTEKATQLLKKIIDFYYPIFEAAANNGWTSEYNNEMNSNEDYISDALVSGTFHLETVDEFGDYDDGNSLTYFLTSGEIEQNTTSDARAELTAWYDAEKARISEKEDWIDMEQTDLSTELEAIKTEMESLKSIIDNAITTVFDWGSA